MKTEQDLFVYFLTILDKYRIFNMQNRNWTVSVTFRSTGMGICLISHHFSSQNIIKEGAVTENVSRGVGGVRILAATTGADTPNAPIARICRFGALILLFLFSS